MLDHIGGAHGAAAARRRGAVGERPAGAARSSSRSTRCATGCSPPAVTPPPASRLTEALRQVFAADADHLPAIVWGEHALRRYQDRLFLTPADAARVGAARRSRWTVGPGSTLGARCPASARCGGSRRSAAWMPARLPPTLSVRQRRGGEVLKPSRRAKTQTVQHLCQSIGVLPWMRDALPMLYRRRGADRGRRSLAGRALVRCRGRARFRLRLGRCADCARPNRAQRLSAGGPIW